MKTKRSCHDSSEFSLSSVFGPLRITTYLPTGNNHFNCQGISKICIHHAVQPEVFQPLVLVPDGLVPGEAVEFEGTAAERVLAEIDDPDEAHDPLIDQLVLDVVYDGT